MTMFFIIIIKCGPDSLLNFSMHAWDHHAQVLDGNWPVCEALPAMVPFDGLVNLPHSQLDIGAIKPTEVTWKLMEVDNVGNK